MSFTLPDLPYAFDALEPRIDARTMEIHHGKHHAGYVKKLNAAVEGTNWAELPVADVCARIDEVPAELRTAVRNNGGGHFNHSLFWTIMGPKGGGEPKGDLAAALKKHFDSFDGFKKRFTEAATGRFGSGWAWLIAVNGGDLAVTSTKNQDNPLMTGLDDFEGKNGTPLLGLDVWEHAYYLKYQNRRPDYIEAWWSLVDWDAVARRFADAESLVSA